MRADGSWPQPRHQAATTCTPPSQAYLNGIDKGDAPSEPARTYLTIEQIFAIMPSLQRVTCNRPCLSPQFHAFPFWGDKLGGQTTSFSAPFRLFFSPSPPKSPLLLRGGTRLTARVAPGKGPGDRPGTLLQRT